MLPQILANALITGSIYALAALGLTLTFSAYRALNFAHGHFVMLGGYLFFFFAHICHLPLAIACLCVLLSAVPLGIFFVKVFIEPFVYINPLLVFVTTLTLSMMLEAIISMFFGVNVLSLSVKSMPPLQLGPIFITHTQLFIVVAALFVGIVSFWCTKMTTYGIRLQALNESSAVVASLGINGKQTSRTAFISSLMIAFIAGIALGFETNIQPTFGSSIMLKAFAAVIIGGLGNPRGALAGAFLLALIENVSIGLDLGAYSLPASYRDSFAFVIILVVLLVKPQGLFMQGARTA